MDQHITNATPTHDFISHLNRGINKSEAGPIDWRL